MGIDFSSLVYLPAQDTFSVDCTFVPLIGTSYPGRGIYDTRTIQIGGDDGSVISDQQTIFDIRTAEFSALPQQGDHVIIPVDCNDEPLGEFEITDAWTNGGGEMTLALKKWISS
jgi:hypothetical protein